MKKKMIIFALSFATVLFVLVGCAAKKEKSVKPTTPKLVLNDKTNTSPSIYDTEQFYQQLIKDYPSLKTFLVRNKKPDSFAIPGLDQTYTLEMDQENKLSVSTQMDPQGLTITDKYVVISAYSKDHKHHSVLYVLNKNSGKYVKLIVLPKNSHVGGITFDPVGQQLWVATKDLQNRPTLSAIKISTLDTYNFKTSRKPIVYDAQLNVPGIKDASYIDYFDNSIFVGYFDEQTGGKLTQLPLNQQRMPDISKRFDRNIKTEKKIQGMTFYKDYIVFSQSYGDQDSKLLVFKDKDKTKDLDLDEKVVVAELDLPPYMEQVKVIGSDIYLLFESATKRYRDQFKGFHADHVFRLNLEKFLAKDGLK